MADFTQGTPVTAPGGNSNAWSDSVSQSTSGSSGSSYSTNNLPGWYTDYMKNLTGAATGAVQTKMSYVSRVGDLYVGCGVYKSLAAR